MSPTILAGTRRGIFIGKKEQNSWRFSGPRLIGQPIYCASADTRGATPVLYAGRNDAHWGPGIHCSSDMGETWTEAQVQPRFAAGSALAVEAVWQIVPGGIDQPNVLYAGTTPAALFRSDDSGRTWRELDGLTKHPTRSEWMPGNGGLCLHSILVNPHDSKHLIVGISSVGVFESFDEGQSWELINTGLPCVFRPGEFENKIGSCIHKIAFAPGKATRIYQQNHQGLFLREGRGIWHNIQGNQPFTFGFPLVAHPRDADCAFVVPLGADSCRAPKDGALAVYVTRDAGKSWTPRRKGLPDKLFNGVLRDAFDITSGTPCALCFGTNGGQIFYSADEGESWEMAADLLPPVNSVRLLS